MKEDIVFRLRAPAIIEGEVWPPPMLSREAADEIERLRTLVRASLDIVQAVSEQRDKLAQAIREFANNEDRSKSEN